MSDVLLHERPQARVPRTKATKTLTSLHLRKRAAASSISFCLTRRLRMYASFASAQSILKKRPRLDQKTELPRLSSSALSG